MKQCMDIHGLLNNRTPLHNLKLVLADTEDDLMDAYPEEKESLSKEVQYVEDFIRGYLAYLEA